MPARISRAARTTNCGRNCNIHALFPPVWDCVTCRSTPLEPAQSPVVRTRPTSTRIHCLNSQGFISVVEQTSKAQSFVEVQTLISPKYPLVRGTRRLIWGTTAPHSGAEASNSGDENIEPLGRDKRCVHSFHDVVHDVAGVHTWISAHPFALQIARMRRRRSCWRTDASAPPTYPRVVCADCPSAQNDGVSRAWIRCSAWRTPDQHRFASETPH